MALQRVFHRLGIQQFAVVKLHPRTQLDHQGLRIGPLVAGGELGNDVQLGIDVEQLVTQSGEDDPSDIGPGQCRIQDVRILAQRHPQRLRFGGGRAEDRRDRSDRE